jgi:CBS domain-containing membrane protein
MRRHASSSACRSAAASGRTCPRPHAQRCRRSAARLPAPPLSTKAAPKAALVARLRASAPLAWRDFLPAPTTVDATERLRAAFGALLGVLLAGLLVQAFGRNTTLPWLVAPIGASAVLVFCVPASPFAQPWAVLGGNVLSTLIGMAFASTFGGAPWVAAGAVGCAIAAMFWLRCLHPPGGACALLVALGGVHDPAFALHPVLLNSVLLVAAGIAYNSATGRRYPHAQRSATPPAPVEGGVLHAFTDADLDAVLARYNQVVDVSRDDLHQLLEQTYIEAYRRRSSHTRCADVMSPDPVAVHFGTPLQEAWTQLREHRFKALPVVDSARRVIGIVTLADFMRQGELDQHEGWGRRLRAFVRPTPTSHSDKPEAVGQIMTRQVRVVSADRPIADLLPMFADTGHHHVPVIDAERRLVGMITQSDLVRALCRGD